MTDRLSALRALAEMVEAGEFDAKPADARLPYFNRFMEHAEAAIPQEANPNQLAWRAYKGSTDAAMVLHEALFPGCDWFVHMHTAAPSKRRWHVYLRPHPNNRPNMREIGPCVGDPARALLLCDLRALIAQEEAKEAGE